MITWAGTWCIEDSKVSSTNLGVGYFLMNLIEPWSCEEGYMHIWIRILSEDFYRAQNKQRNKLYKQTKKQANKQTNLATTNQATK